MFSERGYIQGLPLIKLISLHLGDASRSHTEIWFAHGRCLLISPRHWAEAG